MRNEETIRGLIDHWAASVRARDIDGILLHHAPDILMFDVVEPLQSKGIVTYRESWKNLFFPWYGDDGAFDLSEIEIHAGDRIAFCTAIMSCSGTERGKKVSFTLRLTIGLEQVNGEWMVLHEHHSEPLPITAP